MLKQHLINRKSTMKQLQFITHHTDRYNYLESAAVALEGGCRWIQLRMKESSYNEILETAINMKTLCMQYNATFIIDDHVSIAMAVQAHGVHLGKNDMPVPEARKMTGSGYIIGGTANTFEDLKKLVSEGADYVGLGPFRFTQTKKNLSPVIGLEGYRSIMERCALENIHIPLVAIGGITVADIPPLMEAGVPGIALSSTILQAEDPIAETRNILTALNK